MRPPDAKRSGPQGAGSRRTDDILAAAPLKTDDTGSLPPAAVRPWRCAHLFESLYGCPSPALDGSRFCGEHQDGA